MCWLLVAEHMLSRDQFVPMLYCFKQCCKLASEIPDHTLCFLLYDHMVKVHCFFGNLEGALKCSIKMRNIAQDHLNLK
jgi:phage antirepressor YoqD-like protein